MATEGRWVFYLPATAAGREALRMIRKGLHPSIGLRTYRRPVQDFGKPRKHTTKHLAVYLYPKVERVWSRITCPHCEGDPVQSIEEVQHGWQVTSTRECLTCQRTGKVGHTELRPLNHKAFLSIPERHE